MDILLYEKGLRSDCVDAVTHRHSPKVRQPPRCEEGTAEVCLRIVNLIHLAPGDSRLHPDCESMRLSTFGIYTFRLFECGYTQWKQVDYKA